MGGIGKLSPCHSAICRLDLFHRRAPHLVCRRIFSPIPSFFPSSTPYGTIESMKVLITGGAGYIGSHMVRMLVGAGHDVSVIDTLEYGYKASIPKDIRLFVANVGNREALDRIFSGKPEAVIHFAGYINVEESVRDPLRYMTNNVSSPLVLLEAMEAHGVNKLIFSSTAAVYGTPTIVPIPEDHPKAPTSPYGLSKWNFEQLLAYFDRRGTIRSISLRYFNAAGASLDGNYGEAHEPETHIIPLAMKTAMGQQPSFSLYGTHYPTKDGTCVRDYIHIEDLCQAHVLMLDALAAGHKTAVYNVGTGECVTNREMVAAVKRETGVDFAVVETDPRPGDPHTLVADPTRLTGEFGWKPKHSDISTIVGSAWKWHQKKRYQSTNAC